MKKYTTYKPSGIEWIDDIPEHWMIKPLKYFSQITLGKMLTPEDKGSYYLKPYLRSQNVQIDNVDVSDIKEMWFSNDDLEKYRLKKGDLLVNEGGDVGRTCMWNDEIEECYIQNSVNRVNVIGGSIKYYLFHFYLHHTTGYFNSIVNRVSIPHLTKDKLENVEFIIPPLSEQHQIVRFLDEKTEITDKLISTKERKIELLKQQRTSLINQVITKGLDPNVKMKDSGVEWIGEIPENWKISKLGFYTTKIGSGSTPRGGSEVYVDSGIPFVRSQNVHFNGLRLDDVSYIDSETHNSMRGTIVKRNDVLLNITGGSIGRCCIVHLENEMNINQHVSIIRTTKDLTPFFLNYILSSDIGQSQVMFNISGGNREGLTIEGIRNFNIIIPTHPEQIKIVEFLDKKTIEIDDLVSIEQKKIDLLKEYRQSLISEVITGKIDVRTDLN